MITKSVKRGDIVLVNFGDNEGSIQNVFRPAVVLQRNRYNNSSTTTIVAPITSADKRTDTVTHVVIGKRYGLLERSIILLEQIRTINQSDIDKRVGHIKDESIMCSINAGLRKVLDIKDVDFEETCVLMKSKTTQGLAERKKRKKQARKPRFNQRDIMCLCPVCRDSYRHRGFRVLKAGGNRDVCDLCNYRIGFDYAVVGLLSRR